MPWDNKMKNGKNYFYRINPNEVLGEAIFHEDKEKWFLQFFNDLRNDDPDLATSKLAKEIIEEAHAFREKRAVAGKASAEKKNNKRKQKRTYVEHMSTNVQQCSTEVQQTSTNSSSNSSKTKPKGANAPIDYPEWLPLEQWNAFREMRKQSKKAMTAYAERLRINDLDKYRQQGYDPIKILERSIKKGWQDFYPDQADKVTYNEGLDQFGGY